VKGPFFFPAPYPPSRDPRPPRFERWVEVPVGWAVERLAAPLARWDPAELRTPEVAVAIRGLPPAFADYRIALVTDIHHGPCVPFAWVETLARRTAELKPDLVVLGGDYVSHVRHDLDGLDRALARFVAPDGAVAVLGNHDHWVGADQVLAMLGRARIPVLVNRHRILVRGGAALALAGVDDFRHGAIRLDEALAGIPADVPRVLVSHNPDLIEYLPDGARVDLMLSGHTHNGQIHFPLVGPLTVPSQFGGKYLHGLRRFRETQVYVSAGVGTVSIPIRWGNPPELPILRLTAA
jgi:uncharacterized protein